jgi:phosphatidylinositol-3-phosphatase
MMLREMTAYDRPVSVRRGAAIPALLVLVAAACSSSSRSAAPVVASTTSSVVSSSTSAALTPPPRATTSTVRASSKGVCANPGPVPKRYTSVVVFAFENRTWSDVGLGFGPQMPYLHRLGQQCSSFADWTETDTAQNSLTQYVGQVTGAFQAGTVNDCSPSPSCSTTADNLFRQARHAGLTAIDYVDGATGGCSSAGNAAKHVPALYLWGADDRAHCDTQVRPLTEFNPNRLPAFAFVTPTLCNDGHDCANSVVDGWANTHVQPVLDSAAYQAGHVAVFIWYDEDHPVPNLWITPTARPGTLTTAGAGYAGTLAAWEAMLGLPCLANACTATNMRAAANS